MIFEIISKLNLFQFPQLPSQIFYITLNEEPEIEIWNRDIAGKLKIPELELKHYLVYHFNGWSPDGSFGYYPRVYFQNRNDAENALNWIEATRILAQMKE